MNPAHGAPTVATINSTLRKLLDPEVGINVVDLGMVRDVTVVGDGAVIVTLSPTTPGCPMHEALSLGVQRLIGELPGVTAVEVSVVYDPPWTPEHIAPEARDRLGWRLADSRNAILRATSKP